MREVIVHISDLLSPPIKWADIPPSDLPRLKALREIFTAGKPEVHCYPGQDEWGFLSHYPSLLAYYQEHHDLPLLIPFSNAISKPQRNWLYQVFAVNIVTDMDKLRFQADVSAYFNRLQMQPLVDQINRYFSQNPQDESWHLELLSQPDGDPDYMLILQSDHALPVQMPRIDKQHFAIIEPRFYVKSGQVNSEYWQQTLNELQMFLFQSALMQQQRSHSQPHANAFWIQGKTPAEPIKKPIVHDFDQVLTNDVQLLKLDTKAIQQVPGQPFVNLPVTDSWKILVYLDRIHRSLSEQQMYAWKNDLESLDHNLGSYLIDQLLQNRLDHILIIAGHDSCIRLNKKMLKYYRFTAWFPWRRQSRLPV